MNQDMPMGNHPGQQGNEPYYAVIFTNRLRSTALQNDYSGVAEEMMRLAALQPGYLGVDSVREPFGQGAETALGITVSYWKDEASIKAWRDQVDHALARDMGRERFYQSYHLRVARIEREYSFELD